MSKLKDLVGRGVRLIVTDVPGTSETPAEMPAEAFAEAEAEPAPAPAPASRSEVPADVESFAAVYEEAGIAVAPHGYGIDKVAEMLASKHLSAMAREVKAASVLAALEAAGVSLKDVIQDAVRRDRALDAFEMAKGRAVEELRTQGESRIRAIESEIQEFLKSKNTELEGLKAASEEAKQAFRKLQAKQTPRRRAPVRRDIPLRDGLGKPRDHVRALAARVPAAVQARPGMSRDRARR